MSSRVFDYVDDVGLQRNLWFNQRLSRTVRSELE